MDLNDIYKVASVNNDTVANKLLKHGWKLLKISTKSSVNDEYSGHGPFQESTICFVLGASKEIANNYPISQATQRHYY